MTDRLDMTAVYLRPIWDSCDELIAKAKEGLDNVLFDTLIGTGVSGSIFVPLLARELGCYWAIARKSNDGSHSFNAIEGDIGERWVFVDDLVDSGATLKRVQRQVDNWTDRHNWETEFAGTYLYYEGMRRTGYFPANHIFGYASVDCECERCID